MTQFYPTWPFIIGIVAMCSLFLSVIVIWICKKIEERYDNVAEEVP